jgi:hypothetical protein
MSLFEALFSKKCNTPISWDNPTDKAFVGPKFLREMKEHMVEIKRNLNVTDEKKKIYAYKNMSRREFKVGWHVLLKVKPKRSALRLGSCPKLVVRYCRLFKVL